MFSALFNLKDILSVPVIMVCAAASTALILFAMQWLIKGAMVFFKSIKSHFSRA